MLDKVTACGLFKIVTELFLEQIQGRTPGMVLFDEVCPFPAVSRRG
jgi:hypothetical protein